jgi:hypothetical protein
VTCPWKFHQSDVELAQPELADGMRKSHFTEAQIIVMIKEQEALVCQPLNCAASMASAQWRFTS